MKPEKFRIRQLGTEGGLVLWWTGHSWSNNIESASLYSEGDSYTIFNQMKADQLFVRRVKKTEKS